MPIAELMLIILTVLGFVRTGLGIAHYFKLDALAAAQLEKAVQDKLAKAKATPDPKDDLDAESFASTMRVVEKLIQDPTTVQHGIDVAMAFLKARA